MLFETTGWQPEPGSALLAGLEPAAFEPAQSTLRTARTEPISSASRVTIGS